MVHRRSTGGYAYCSGCGKRVVSKGRRGKVKTALARAMERHVAGCKKCR